MSGTKIPSMITDGAILTYSVKMRYVALWLVWGYASSYLKGSKEERKVWRLMFLFGFGFLVIGLALVFVIVLILTRFQ